MFAVAVRNAVRRFAGGESVGSLAGSVRMVHVGRKSGKEARELTEEELERIKAFNDGTYAQPLRFDQDASGGGGVGGGEEGGEGGGKVVVEDDAGNRVAIPELAGKDEVVRVGGYTSRGFNVSGVRVGGGVFLLPSMAMLWDVESVESLTSDSLILPQILIPRMDLLLLGTGKTMARVEDALLDPLRDAGIVVQVMDSANAAATFNFLAEEGRAVGAALMPIAPFSARKEQEQGQW